jgi:hypothetical protein
MNNWEKAKHISAIISAIVIPCILAILTHTVNLLRKDSENRVKMAELAIDLLKQEPRDEDRDLRAFAVELLQRSTDVDVPRKYFEQTAIPGNVGITKVKITSDPSGASVEAVCDRRRKEQLRYKFAAPFEGYLPSGKYTFTLTAPNQPTRVRTRQEVLKGDLLLIHEGFNP